MVLCLVCVRMIAFVMLLLILPLLQSMKLCIYSIQIDGQITNLSLKTPEQQRINEIRATKNSQWRQNEMQTIKKCEELLCSNVQSDFVLVLNKMIGERTDYSNNNDQKKWPTFRLCSEEMLEVRFTRASSHRRRRRLSGDGYLSMLPPHTQT